MNNQDVGIDLPSTPQELLAQMARMYKYELSDFEALLWTAQVFSVYPAQAVMRALMAHMESGTHDANFMPRHGAIKAKLEPVVGFKEIEQAIKQVGPYQLPNITDPVLLTAIEQMGGWARVCNELPDPVVRPIDFDRYVKRFEVAILAAKNQVQVQGHKPAKLKCIGNASSNGAAALTHSTSPALPAPVQNRATAAVELQTNKASIWSRPKP
jgi:hypothetical protein